MIGRIRRRLTLGYVGILAFILVILGVAVTASFTRQAISQQDEVLKQRAQSTQDFVRNFLLQPPPDSQQGGGASGSSVSGPVGPIRSATDSDVGLVAVGVGEDDSLLEESPAASSFGLPYKRLARAAASRGEPVTETVSGPQGERVRVISVPVRGAEGEVVVVQTAQDRSVVRNRVDDLVLVLVSVGLGGLALAALGGAFMSRRAMRPVEESFHRQRTFIADASHEIKTPLALVKTSAEVMQRNPASPENRELIDDQLEEIDRMNALVSDMLVLARIDAGKLDVQHKQFDLSSIGAETASRFLTLAAARDIRLEIALPDPLPAQGDPERTDQILATLLDNAVRHTPEGGTVTIRGRLLDGRVEVSVEDTGPGISKGHLPHVFDRFYRAETARTRMGAGGTGLGLSIASDFALAQGGNLSVVNAANGETNGAVFRLALQGQ